MIRLNKQILLIITLICLVSPFAIIWGFSLAKNVKASGSDDWAMFYLPQQKEIITKVESAGGWDALKNDCISYAKGHQSGMFNVDYYWNGGSVPEYTRELPATMNALHPIAVYCLNNENTSPVVLVYFTRELGLEVRCGNSTIPNSKFFKFYEHQITNDVYMVLRP